MDYIFEDLMSALGNKTYSKTKLSDMEERAYFDIIKSDKASKPVKLAAIKKIVQNHILFVVSVAKQYTSFKCNVNDLINVGILGMHRAILSFDHSKEVRFISYAVWWVRQTILDYCYEQSNLIKTPELNQRMLTKLKKEADKLGVHYTDLVESNSELAKLQDVDNALNLMSMDAPLKSDTNDDVSDMTFHNTHVGEDLEKEKQVDSVRRKLLQEMDQKITPKEKQVLMEFYGFKSDNYTLDEIAEGMKLSRERIRTLKNRALSRMKKGSEMINYQLPS